MNFEIMCFEVLRNEAQMCSHKNYKNKHMEMESDRMLSPVMCTDSFTKFKKAHMEPGLAKSVTDFQKITTPAIHKMLEFFTCLPVKYIT